MTSILMGICLSIPLFDDTGPPCSPAAQAEECRCTECMKWAAAAETPQDPAVIYYEIERTDPGGGFHSVGINWRFDWTDEDGIEQTQPPSNIWCFAKDDIMPLEGQLYGYRVRACNLSGCSDYFEAVEYRAAPYAIDTFRPPTQGN